MSDQKNSFLQSFQKRKQTQVDEVSEQAQKLINLFRHIDSFDGDFPAELDQMLLNAPAEVQTAFSNFAGGAVVRQYCDYLKEQTHSKNETADNVQENMEKQVGYLPSPDEDVVGCSGMTGDAAQIEMLIKQINEKHQQEIEKILKTQTEAFSQLMQRFDQNTHEVASHQTDRLIEAMSQEKNKKKYYSDVIESTNVEADIPFVSEEEGL